MSKTTEQSEQDYHRRCCINGLDAEERLRAFIHEKWWFTAHYLLCAFIDRHKYRLYPWQIPDIKGKDKDHPLKDTEFLLVHKTDTRKETEKARVKLQEAIDFMVSHRMLTVMSEKVEDNGKTLLYTLKALEK